MLRSTEGDSLSLQSEDGSELLSLSDADFNQHPRVDFASLIKPEKIQQFLRHLTRHNPYIANNQEVFERELVDEEDQRPRVDSRVAYDLISESMPSSEPIVGVLIVGSSALVVGALGSLFYLKSSEKFFTMVINAFNSDATGFVKFTEACSYTYNTMINGESCEMLYYSLRYQYRTKNAPLINEKSRKTFRRGNILVSAAGAVPAGVMMWDLLAEGNKAWAVFNSGLQWGIVTALNWRGTNNLIKLDSENKRWAKMFRLVLMMMLYDAMVDDDLKTDELRFKIFDYYSKGNKPRKGGKPAKYARWWISRLYGLSGLLYTAGFFQSVMSKIVGEDAPDLTGLWVAIGSVVAVMAFAQRGLLIGNANIPVAEDFISLMVCDPHAFPEIRSIRDRNIEWAMNALSGVFAPFSMGGVYWILHRYVMGNLWGSEAGGIGCLATCMALGFATVFPLNFTSQGANMARYLKGLVNMFNKKYYPDVYADYKYGKSHNEYILRIMKQLFMMPDEKLLKRFGKPFRMSDFYSNKLSEEDAAMVRDLLENGLIAMSGYVFNDDFFKFQAACKIWKTNGPDNASFKAWRDQKMRDMADGKDKQCCKSKCKCCCWGKRREARDYEHAENELDRLTRSNGANDSSSRGSMPGIFDFN